MSLPDSAEYWNDVKDHFRYPHLRPKSPPNFVCPSCGRKFGAPPDSAPKCRCGAAAERIKP